MKKMMGSRLLSLLLAFCLLFALTPAALAEGGDEDGEDEPIVSYKLVSVTVNPTTVSQLQIGKTQDLTATVTVEKTTTTSEGTSTETITYTKDTLKEELPAGLTLEWRVAAGREKEVSLQTYEGTTPLRAVATALAVAPSNASPKAVFVTLSVSLNGVPLTSDCGITVISSETPGIKVEPAVLELVPEGTGTLSATVTPESADQKVVWNTADAGIATVESTGDTTARVTAGKTPGEVQINATANGLQTSSKIQVQGILLDSETLSLRVGDRHTLNWRIIGDSLQDNKLIWTSDKPEIVQAETGGYLYAKAEGEATITVQIEGYSNFTDSIKVTVKRRTAEVIRASAGAGEPLSFSDLVSQIQACSTDVLGKSLSYVSSLSVPTSQGTLYYKYTSEGDTGAGVATSASYYVSPTTGQNALSEITFVPKNDFSGTAVISYTGYASGTEFFQGTIEVTVEAQQDVTYTTANNAAVQMDPTDFAVVCRARTGRDLSYVTFTLPDSSAGTLYYHYLSAMNPGTEVRTSTEYKYSGTPALGEVYFVPASGYSGRVIITYTAYDTNRESFQGRLVIQVNDSSGSEDGLLNYTVSPGRSVSFNVDDFNTLSRNITGDSLNYVRFELPSSSQGTLYYDYGSSTAEKVSSSKSYYRSSIPYLSRVSFVAASDYTGMVTIPFTGWSSGGTTFSGSVTIRVGSGSTAINYQTAYGKAVTFQTGDFNSASQAATGGNLSYVRFSLPSSSQGTLYYNYENGRYDSTVSSSKNYYRTSSPYLDEISFVPASGYTGTVSFSYTGWSVGGQRFTGTVTIQVGNESENIRYTTNEGESVAFRASDFNSVCQAATGSTLNYVRFTLPASTRGTLYCNGSKVTATQNYSYSSPSPTLSQVSFVPTSGYSGTVSITYTGWATNGDRFTGTVTIRVGSQSSGIAYDTKGRTPADFQAEDFNDVSLFLTGSTLNYVRFTLPASSQGTLYYKYNNGSYDSKVTASKNYYRSSSPYLDEVSFVPASNFTGTCSISYTAWAVNGDRFTGTVTVQVGTKTSTIYYDTELGEPVTFRPTDFNDAAQSAVSRDLNYVRFTLPSSSQGTLYYKYENGSYDSKVTASKSYYRSSSPYLDEVSFVPAAGFTGTCSITYTGWTTGGTSFTGTVEITVANTTSDTASTIRYTTSYAPVTFRASDFTAACNSRGRGTLTSVRFNTDTLSSNAGRLYHQYNGIQSANTEVRSTTVYYPETSPSLSQVTFAPRMGFQGTAVLSYTGVDSQGRTYQGQVEITVTPNTSSNYFTDMATGYSWAAASVDFLYENDVVGGVGNNSFAPAAPLTRGSFITMLDRALGFSHSSQKSFPDVPDGQYYTESVRSAYALGIVNGFSDGTFRPDAPITRAEAVTMLYRAMQTMGWVIGTENPSILSSYSDGAYVADYARGAMSVMVQTGVVQGSGGLLEPGRIMTRAEMAVALARALTL